MSYDQYREGLYIIEEIVHRGVKNFDKHYATHTSYEDGRPGKRFCIGCFASDVNEGLLS